MIFVPFQSFSTNHEKFYLEYKSEYENISNNLINLKTKTNKALFDYRNSKDGLNKVKNEECKIEKKQKLILEIQNKVFFNLENYRM